MAENEVNLEALTPDELVELNQELGREIDAVREYRRKVKAVHDEKVFKASIAAKLTPEELAQLSVTVTPAPLSLNIKGHK